MDRVEVQRTLVQTEQVFHEGGPPPARCLLRGFACAVIANPYAGRYESDILPLMEALPSLGRKLAEELVAALGCEPERIAGFGGAGPIHAATPPCIRSAMISARLNR